MPARRTILSVAIAITIGAGAIAAGGGRESITSAELKEWLTYVASDELEGRAVYTEGFGLADIESNTRARPDTIAWAGVTRISERAVAPTSLRGGTRKSMPCDSMSC